MLPDIGGWEFALVILVGLIVFKPKDLPIVLRKVGQFVGQAKRLAADFRASFEDMARQSELDDLRKEVESMRRQAETAANPAKAVRDTITETTGDIEASLKANAPAPAPEPAAPETPAEPKSAAAKPRKAAPKSTAKPKAEPAKKQSSIVEGGKRS